MSTGKENNEQLVQKIKAGEDVTGNMAKLWQQNRNFVYLIARKYAKTETDIDDLIATISKWFAVKSDKREEVRKACFKEIDTNWNPYYQMDIIKKNIKF